MSLLYYHTGTPEEAPSLLYHLSRVYPIQMPARDSLNNSSTQVVTISVCPTAARFPANLNTFYNTLFGLIL